MCLGIPGLVVSVDKLGSEAVVETFGLKTKVRTELLDDVAPGDYVIVHAGYAIGKIDVAEARARLDLWRELLETDVPEVS